MKIFHNLCLFIVSIDLPTTCLQVSYLTIQCKILSLNQFKATGSAALVQCVSFMVHEMLMERNNLMEHPTKCSNSKS